MKQQRGKLIRLEETAARLGRIDDIITKPIWEMSQTERLEALRKINVRDGHPPDYRDPDIAKLTTKQKVLALREFRIAREYPDEGLSAPTGLRLFDFLVWGIPLPTDDGKAE